MLPTVSPRGFLRVTQVAAGLVVLNIVSGAAVRLSDSGLGCPDWPTCSKHHLTPPLSLHPAIEFSNRLVVVALSLVVALAVLAALARRPRRPDLTWLSVGLIGGILGEIVIGGLVVYSKLNPYVVMVHFMVGIALLTVAVILALRAGRAPGRGTLMVAPRVRTLTLWMLPVLVLAIAAGTATTGAGPHAGGKGAKRIPIALADMARTHAEIVLCLGVMTLVLLYLLDRTGAPERVALRGRILLAVMVAQGLIGYTQYFSHLPPLLVGLHVFGVTVLWTTMLWFYDGLFHHPADPAWPGVPTVPSAQALSPKDLSPESPSSLTSGQLSVGRTVGTGR